MDRDVAREDRNVLSPTFVLLLNLARSSSLSRARLDFVTDSASDRLRDFIPPFRWVLWWGDRLRVLPRSIEVRSRASGVCALAFAL